MNNEPYSTIVIDNAKREKYFSKYATKSGKAVRQKEEPIPDKANIRPAFFHDADRIMHSMAYTRYIDKTQAFFLFEHDHITHRALHVQFVSKIARVIGRCLKLNEDLIEAIALGHDIGHAPYGHDGEAILNKICMTNNIGSFYHSAHSVRVLKDLDKDGKGLNLTLQVLDGILCHNGEILGRRYTPNKEKNWKTFLNEHESCMKDATYCKKIFPMTLEGCVVRIADVIAYIGRDIEDAITIKLIEREDIPKQIAKVLGATNEKIINTLTMDLIRNSFDQPFLEFTEEVYNALEDLKTFNYERIYRNPIVHSENLKIKRMFRALFKVYLGHVRKKRTCEAIFRYFLQDMSRQYLSDTPPERQVIDYMAGMTDDFFNNQYKDLFYPRNYGYELDGSTISRVKI